MTKVGLVLAASGGLLASLVSAQEATWYRESFRIQAGTEVLDTAVWDEGAHAAPFLVDLDEDGRRDLVVGSIVGKFRFLRNTGSNQAPAFGAEPTWLMSDGAPAQIPNYCCVAAGGQLLDVDGDGIADLASGSYAPGTLYFFKGLGKGRFAARQLLTDSLGYPILLYAETAGTVEKRADSYASNIAWTHWNDDDRPDLLLGGGQGELVVRLGEPAGDIAAAPNRSQPLFKPKSWQKEVYAITIQGENAVPDAHAAPAVADWDGDGLWDILIGTYDGSVYWLRNTGRSGVPEFKTRERLLPAGTASQWLAPGAVAQRGRRSQIHVADFNLDGKPDLLVGDWYLSVSPRRDLNRRERRELQDIRRRLADLDARAGYDHGDMRSKGMGYRDKNDLRDAAMLLERQLMPYVETRLIAQKYPTLYKSHGTVWVFLRR